MLESLRGICIPLKLGSIEGEARSPGFWSFPLRAVLPLVALLPLGEDGGGVNAFALDSLSFLAEVKFLFFKSFLTRVFHCMVLLEQSFLPLLVFVLLDKLEKHLQIVQIR